LGSGELDAGPALDGGQALTHPAHGPDGSSRGIQSDGGSDASTAGGNEGGVNWESEVGGAIERDGEESG